MDKYFLITEVKYEGMYVEEYDTKDIVLDIMEKRAGYKRDYTFRVIKGKELKVTPKDIVKSYDLEETHYKSPEVSIVVKDE